jgi:hypothetical protein
MVREVKWSEVKFTAVKEGNSGRTVKVIYGSWSEVKFTAVKEGNSGRTVKVIYGWWPYMVYMVYTIYGK